MDSKEMEVKDYGGLIIENAGGAYTVETDNGLISCKARGVFRKDGISPCAGDRCLVEGDVITEIAPRKNELIRPPLANIDVIFFVVSTCEPSPNLTLLDKFIAVCEYKEISPVICVTKTDLQDPGNIPAGNIPDIYGRIGIPVIISKFDDPGECAGKIREICRGKICAFTGNTGVGKSTLLNAVAPGLALKTGEISRKLGRGRHTTRVSRLFKIDDCYIADTPGFSVFETGQYAVIYKDRLKYCFREFEEYEGKCRFTDCNHIAEKGCAVLEAAEKGDIAPSRLASYGEMFREAQNIKEWETGR